MNTNHPLSSGELKRVAKTALSGHYGTMIGITVLLAVFSLLITYLFSFIGTQLYLMCSVTFATDSAILRYALMLLVNFIGSLLSCLFTVGSARAYICLLYNQPVHVSMLFYGFKKHPDRIILSNLPLILISLVLSIPSVIYSDMYQKYASDYMDSISSLSAVAASEAIPLMSSSMMRWALIAMVASLILFICVLPFVLMDYLLVEMEDATPREIIRTGFVMMKGRKLRYAGLIVSFIGWLLLGVCTCGIGLIWVMPYMEASQAAFYMDSKRIYLEGQNFTAQ